VSDTELSYVNGVTSAIQNQINAKSPSESPTFTGTVTLPSTTTIGDVSGTEIGYLNGVTSQVQNQIDSKAPVDGPTFTGSVTLPSTTYVGNVSGTEIGYLNGVTSEIQGQIDSKAPISGPTFTGTVVLPSTTSIGDVSATEIGYVNGVTSSIQNQIDTKASNTDLTNHNNDTTNVHGIADTDALATKTYADNAISTHNSDTTDVHGIADTSALATKSYVDAADALKAPLASPTFTGTVSGITKSMVGLGNVDNTSDANKPVSTATQTALDAKLSLAGGTMTGALTLSGAPTQDAHAATKAYVDNVTAGINFHQPVRVATTGNITLSGTQTIDGVSLSVGDRVLVKDQTTQTQNGIYVVASGSWTRATDADNTPDGELKGGDFTLVLEGTVNSGYGYVCSNTSAITIGTTNVTYAAFNAAKAVTAGTGLTETTPGTLAVDSSTVQYRVSGVSDTEIGYLDGVTSAIQTQIDAKAPTANPTFTGTVTVAASGVAFTDGTQTKQGVPSQTTITAVSAAYNLSTGGLSLRDQMIEVGHTGASAIDVTVPTDATTNFPIGTSIDLLRTNTGGVQIVGASGVTVNATPGAYLRARWSSATLFKRAANTWVLMGDLASS
jgi:hypothetical protein